MDKLLRVLFGLGFMAFVAANAFADLEVTILQLEKVGGADVVTAFVDRTATNGFNLWMSPTPGNPKAILELLKCNSRPCTIYFPSGRDNNNPLSTDTFAFRDLCGTPFPPCIVGTARGTARIEKVDSDTDRIQLTGLQITALKGGADKTLKIIFTTGPGNFATLPDDGSGTYPISVMFNGNFTNQPMQNGGGGLTASCPPPHPNMSDLELQNPCAQLLLKGNASIADSFGDAGTATVSIPCYTRSETEPPSPSPCFGGYSTQGLFSNRESDADITCPAPCNPEHEGTLSVKFTAEHQSIVLFNSGITAMSKVAAEKFGVEVLYHSLADEFEQPFWVAFAAANEAYRAIPHMKDAKTSDKVVPLAFELEQASPIPAKKGITLTSIATVEEGSNGDNKLLPGERARNDRSYASFIAKPKQFRWKDIGRLRLDYDFTVGKSISDDPRFDGLTFSDCMGASFYLRVALTTGDDRDAGNLIVRLGSSNQFTERCAAAKLKGVDLLDNSEPRVDDSQLSGKPTCCMSVKESRGKYGALYVRSISVVVDQGSSDTKANYQVHLHQAIVNDFKITDTLVIANHGRYEKVTSLPVTGRSMVISRADTSSSKPLITIGNDGIENKGTELRATVPVEALRGSEKVPAPGTKYRVDLCLFGGRCVPRQGSFTLW